MNESEFSSELLEKHTPLPRILVVDDEPLIRYLYAEVLREFGCDVNEAKDGMVAWKALQIIKYDLLIPDNDMPNMTGVK